MKRTTTVLAGLATAGTLLLAGCGGSDTAAPAAPSSAMTSSAMTSGAGSSTAMSSTGMSSGAMSSNAVSSSAMPSSAMSSGGMSSGGMSPGSATSLPGAAVATTTVGGDVTELDAQSTTWFDTACTTLDPLVQYVTDPPQLNDIASLGASFVTLGDALTVGAATLQKTPPPTFEGGSDLAAQTTQALAAFGPSLSQFGTQATILDPQDTASQQQFLTELQATFAELPGLLQFDVTDALKTQIAAIPSCAPLFPSS